MKITGIHLLLTYQCTLECDHCFVWGSPWQTGTLTLEKLGNLLAQAQDLGTVEWFYFEGGEPFLYYIPLLKGVQEAASMGFKVGLVTNAYWATDLNDAVEWLKPFQGLVQDLSVSSDRYHWSEELSLLTENARLAAKTLDIPVGYLSVAQPETTDAATATGQLPIGDSAVMYRGRAAKILASRAEHKPWREFTTCPYENLRDPGRVHIDPLGNIQLCQGISLGNVFQTPLGNLCRDYSPDEHPIAGPLLDGGPAELVRRYNLEPADKYADACHLCDESRQSLRGQFPQILTPDQIYGEF